MQRAALPSSANPDEDREAMLIWRIEQELRDFGPVIEHEPVLLEELKDDEASDLVGPAFAIATGAAILGLALFVANRFPGW